MVSISPPAPPVRISSPVPPSTTSLPSPPSIVSLQCATEQLIVAAVADDGVGERIAGAVDGVAAGQRQIFEFDAESVDDRGLDRVGAAGGQFGYHIAGIVDDIDVVVGAAGHDIGSGSAVQGVGPDPAIQRIDVVAAVERVVAVPAVEDVVAESAVERVVADQAVAACRQGRRRR